MIGSWLLSREESDTSVAVLKVANTLYRETFRVLHAVELAQPRAPIHAL
ncbi:MAG: hypothetical protein P0111_06755 [Nitrospira sp.]|nr:hypothetical protein [Nitrospira sp.]